MSYQYITEPGQLGGLEIRNRISLSPMEKNWCDRLGNPTQHYIDYYARRARNGVGMMNFEATYTDARGRGNLYQLGLWSDDNIAGHKRLVGAVQAHGCRASAELNHGGRNTDTRRTGLQPVGPSNCPSDLVGDHQVRELTKEEIAGVVDGFRQSARRAVEAGYDIITIHGAHGYLITSFLSHVHNRRDDEYGGSDENRWRFLTEVYRAIRDEVGNAMPVGVRLSAQEEVKGGYGIDYSIGLVNHLASLGLDFVDLSNGIYESFEMIIQPMDLRQGYLLPLAKRMKAAVSIPVISAGRINDMDIAERAIAGGECDFVHMSRAFHADPEILSKTLDGRKHDVVGCIACNKCAAELSKSRPVVCTVNVEAGRERDFELKRAKTSRKVMVAGGGMAGMEAARTAAERGHNVVLYEKTDRLGGWLNILRAPRNRLNWDRAIKDRIRLCERAGVEIVLERAVDQDLIRAENPDVLITATGTRPFMPKYVPGIDVSMVTNYEEIISGRVGVGVNTVVVGGQNLGLVTAEYMADNGAKALVIETSDELAVDVEHITRKMLLERVDENSLIDVRLDTNVERIDEGNVTVQSRGELETLTDIDQVVFALDRDMNRDLVEELSGGMLGDFDVELHMVGDCVWPGEPYDAVLSGYRTGRTI